MTTKKPARKRTTNNALVLPKVKHGVPQSTINRIKRSLDKRTSSALGTFWSQYHRGTPTASQELLGGRYPNGTKVASRLGSYAINLATAKSVERDGSVQGGDSARIAKQYRAIARAIARSLQPTASR